jgi:hypothetical protein
VASVPNEPAACPAGTYDPAGSGDGCRTWWAECMWGWRMVCVCVCVCVCVSGGWGWGGARHARGQARRRMNKASKCYTGMARPPPLPPSPPLLHPLPLHPPSCPLHQLYSRCRMISPPVTAQHFSCRQPSAVWLCCGCAARPHLLQPPPHTRTPPPPRPTCSPVGAYCPAGATSPTPCPAGTYQPYLGQASASACLACPSPSQFTSDPGADSCTVPAVLACPSGEKGGVRAQPWCVCFLVVAGWVWGLGRVADPWQAGRASVGPHTPVAQATQLPAAFWQRQPGSIASWPAPPALPQAQSPTQRAAPAARALPARSAMRRRKTTVWPGGWDVGRICVGRRHGDGQLLGCGKWEIS